ncbi:hypothetical protein CF15_03245 [Pyrodictium occultum]|uniref:Transporter n=1 Tax=Pyrodictium occultum TaxID=2309 RepID=A0A0V8RUU2_PYROC|nr:AEC family transporter [Pyrodictium occultum]KSW11830.1 hypothetical protein CF15_03245 [Pyrodictium occultum]
MAAGAAVAARALVAVGLLAAGLLAGRSRAASTASRAISLMLLWFSVPFIVLYKIYTVDLVVAGKYALLVPASVLGALASAYLLIPRLLRGLPSKVVGAAVLAAGFHNAGFLPIPLMLILYDDAGPAALYSTLVNIIAAVAVPLVAGAYSPVGEAGSTAGKLAASLARFPPFYALVAGTLLYLLAGGHPWLAEALGILGHVAAESTLSSFFLVGSVLAYAGIGFEKPVLAVLAWRLGVEPAIALAASTLLGLQGVWLAGALIEAFMPPATMNLVYAALYGLDETLVAKAIGLTLPFSIAAAVLIRLLVH